MMRGEQTRQAAPLLPPPFRLVTLREAGDAFAHARAIAEDAGAGTLVWTRRFDLVECAVVLEPEEPLATARKAALAGMLALADALAAHAPPEKAVSFDYPATLRFDGARIGGGRLAWPAATREHDVPTWLVFGGMIMADGLDPQSPGHSPDATSLVEEGLAEADAASLIESFARHLMLHLYAWHDAGFGGLAHAYLERLSRTAAEGRRRLDGQGNLLVEGGGQARTILLAEALRDPPWYEAETGMPRL